MLGLLMSLSLVYPLSMLVRGIVEEREKRLKETMCIMGLQGWVLHAGESSAHVSHGTALNLDVSTCICLCWISCCFRMHQGHREYANIATRPDL